MVYSDWTIPSAFVLTLGDKGAIYADKNTLYRVNAVPVKAVDTTAAGDTFTGYFLFEWARGTHPQAALARAAEAAAISALHPPFPMRGSCRAPSLAISRLPLIFCT